MVHRLAGTIAVLLLVVSPSHAGHLEPWTYRDLLVKSDLVVIARPVETKALAQTDRPPDAGSVNGRPLAPFLEQVETVFDIRAFVRGKSDGKRLTVVHFRWNQAEIDKELRCSEHLLVTVQHGPSLVEFPNESDRVKRLMDAANAGRDVRIEQIEEALVVADCLLFLRRRKDGKYEPVTGQSSATSSVRWLAVPVGSDPDQKSAGAETDADLENLRGRTEILSLHLSVRHITDEGLKYLETLNQLRWLDLGGTPISDAGLEHLEGLYELRWLNLSQEAPRLLDVSRESFAHSGGTRVTDAGLEHLRGLRQLRTLYLIGGKISDAGLKHLQSLHRLESLDLSHTLVTDAGLTNLKGLHALERLYLQGTKVTDKGVKELLKSLPGCTIETESPVRA